MRFCDCVVPRACLDILEKRTSGPIRDRTADHPSVVHPLAWSQQYNASCDVDINVTHLYKNCILLSGLSILLHVSLSSGKSLEAWLSLYPSEFYFVSFANLSPSLVCYEICSRHVLHSSLPRLLRYSDRHNQSSQNKTKSTVVFRLNLFCLFHCPT